MLEIAAEGPRFDITSPTKYKATQVQGIITIDLMLKTQLIEFKIFLVNICHCYVEINFMLGSNAFIWMMTCPIMLYTNQAVLVVSPLIYVVTCICCLIQQPKMQKSSNNDFKKSKCSKLLT